MSRWLWGLVIFTLGVAGPTAASPLAASGPVPAHESLPHKSSPHRTIEEGDAPQLAKRRRRKRRRSKRKKRKSRRERKKEAAEAKRKAAEEAAAKKAAEEKAARQAAEEAAKKEAAEKEAARLAALPVLAVLPLGGTDVALSDLGTLNQALRDALAATDQFRLQEQATTNELVAASQSLGVDCASAAEACADRLGALAGASYAVVGQVVFLPPAEERDDEDAGDGKGAPVSILGGKLGVHLAMMPVGGGDELAPPRRVRGLIPSDPAALADNLTPLLSALLDRERDLGDVQLNIKPPGALVAVDGLPLGASPVSSPGGLLPGQHVVKATLEGHLPKALTVQVGTRRQEVTILLEEDPDLVKERSIAWWEIAAPWSVFGVGAVASLGGAAAMAFTGLLVVAAGQTYGGIETLDRSAATYPQDASAGYQQNAFVRGIYDMAGLYALIGGGVFLAAGGLLAAAGAGWGSYYFVVDRSEE